MFHTQIFIAQGGQDADPCGDADPCADIELIICFYFQRTPLCHDADPCDFEQTKAAVWGAANTHTLCQDLDTYDPNQITADMQQLGARMLRLKRVMAIEQGFDEGPGRRMT